MNQFDQIVAQELGMLRLEVLRLKVQLVDASSRLAAANAEVARLSPPAGPAEAVESDPSKVGDSRNLRPVG